MKCCICHLGPGSNNPVSVYRVPGNNPDIWACDIHLHVVFTGLHYENVLKEITEGFNRIEELIKNNNGT